MDWESFLAQVGGYHAQVGGGHDDEGCASSNIA